MKINKYTIPQARDAAQCDIGIFYNVDAGIKVVSPAPEGLEVGQHYYDESGSVLICRGIAKLSDPDPVYTLAYQFSEHVYRDRPAETPEDFYAEEKEDENFGEDNYSDDES